MELTYANTQIMSHRPAIVRFTYRAQYQTRTIDKERKKEREILNFIYSIHTTHIHTFRTVIYSENVKPHLIKIKGLN